MDKTETLKLLAKRNYHLNLPKKNSINIDVHDYNSCQMHKLPLPLAHNTFINVDTNVYNKQQEEKINQIDALPKKISTSVVTVPHVVGGVAALLGIFAWVAVSEVIPVFETNYAGPFLIGYTVMASSSLMFPAWLIVRHLSSGSDSNVQDVAAMVVIKNNLKPACFLSLLAISSSYLWCFALSEVDPAISDTIYQCSIVFIYILSIFLFGIPFTLQKCLAIFCSIVGVCLISFNKSQGGDKDNDNNNIVLGSLLSVIASAMFATLEVTVKYSANQRFSKSKTKAKAVSFSASGSSSASPTTTASPEPELEPGSIAKVEHSLLLMWMFGVATAALFWPLFFVLDYLQIETFSWPQSQQDYLSVFLPALLLLIYHTSLFVGITFTSALFMGMTQLLVVPLSFYYSAMYLDLKITWQVILGSILILVGVSMIELPIASYLKFYFNKY